MSKRDFRTLLNCFHIANTKLANFSKLPIENTRALFGLVDLVEKNTGCTCCCRGFERTEHFRSCKTNQCRDGVETRTMRS